jgi:hypothetical protein
VNKTAATLFKLGLNIAGWSTLVYVVAGFWLTIRSVAGVLSQPTVLAFAALGIIFGIFLIVIGHFLDVWSKNRIEARSRFKPLIPLEPREKEAGYNEAVIHWFHNGPELRERNDDYRAGFAARAKVPPPKRRKDP